MENHATRPAARDTVTSSAERSNEGSIEDRACDNCGECLRIDVDDPWEKIVELESEVERLLAEKDRSDVAREQVERHLHQMKEDMAHLRDAITSLRASLVEERAKAIWYRIQSEEFDDYEGWMQYWPGDEGEYHKFAPSIAREIGTEQADYYREKARAALGSDDKRLLDCPDCGDRDCSEITCPHHSTSMEADEGVSERGDQD